MKKTIDIKNIVKCGIIAIVLTVLCVPLKTHAATITSIKELSEDEIEKTLEESKECESMYDSALKKKIEVDYAKRTIKNSTPVGWIIFKINNNETNIPLNSGATYSANNLSFSEIDEITGLYSATVYFKTKAQYLLINDSCYIKDLANRATFAGGSSFVSDDSTCTNAVTEAEYNKELSRSLDCNIPKNQFETEFCKTKAAAMAADRASSKHVFDMTTNSTYSQASATFSGTRFKSTYVIGDDDLKCATDVNDETKVPSNPSALKGNDYFVNQQGYYAEHIQTLSTTYYYYYAPQGPRQPAKPTNGGTVTCKRVCGEAVLVEYGPPVAKKAGMNFEYRVRVTSRVDCHADTTDFPPPPKCDCTYCSPAPTCAHYNGDGAWYGPQAGPNSEFEACINQCDGGKYTKNCSSKCYKKVYANKSANEASQEVLASKTVGEYGTLEHCKSLSANPRGCYFRQSSAIDWSDNHPNNAGRWYYDNHMTHNMGCGIGQFCPDEHGFRRKVFDDGSICSATCWWIPESCRPDQYLNPGYGAADCDKNTDKWRKLIDACNEQATCNTTVAYYTIAAGYNDGEIIFPRGATNNITDGDKTRGQGKIGSLNPKSTLLPDYPETQQGIRGCYNFDRNHDPEPNRLYLTTWGFPSTWIHAKTGEISYDSQAGKPGWGELVKRFVIPFDQRSVNADWWNAFYHKKIGTSSAYTINNPDVQAKCITSSENTLVNPKQPPTIEKWNIQAHTREFGWFKWNFDIQCFYATNRKPLVSTDCVDCNDTPKECESPKDNVRVRTVDLENMFPSSDGQVLSSPNTTGRQPGFNWSQYAVQKKNADYQSNPPELTKEIQTLGYDVYDDATYGDKYLDYKFVITPSMIRTMRGQSKRGGETGNYTDFDDTGFFLDEYGVQRYYSKRIRNLSTEVPAKKWLKCNNLGEYRTGCHNPS